MQTIAEAGPMYCDVLFKVDMLEVVKLSLQRYHIARMQKVPWRRYSQSRMMRAVDFFSAQESLISIDRVNQLTVSCRTAQS
jgi:hypothetical protein